MPQSESTSTSENSWLSRIPLFNSKSAAPATSATPPTADTSAMGGALHGSTTTDKVYDAKDSALDKAKEWKAAMAKDNATPMKVGALDSIPKASSAGPDTATASTPTGKLQEWSAAVSNKATELTSDARQAIGRTTQDLKAKAEEGMDTLRGKTSSAGAQKQSPGITFTSEGSTVSSTKAPATTAPVTSVTPVSDAASHMGISTNTAMDKVLHGSTATDKIYQAKDYVLGRLKREAPIPDPSTMTIDSPVVGAGSTVGRYSNAENSEMGVEMIAKDAQRRLSATTPPSAPVERKASVSEAVSEGVRNMGKAATSSSTTPTTATGAKEARSLWMWRRPSRETHGDGITPFHHIMPEDLALDSENLTDILKDVPTRPRD